MYFDLHYQLHSAIESILGPGDFGRDPPMISWIQIGWIRPSLGLAGPAQPRVLGRALFTYEG